MTAMSIKMAVLGGAKEVGRSAILLDIENTNILLDFGVKLGAKKLEDHIPIIEKDVLRNIDVVVVSHAHLDHAGAVPMLLKQKKAKINILCSPPTKNLMSLMCLDYLRNTKFKIYNQNDIARALRKMRCIEYLQPIRVKKLKITLIPAGHLLGAAQVLIEYGKIKILYTGDVNFRRSLSLEPAPKIPADIIIMESTYGNTVHEPLGVVLKKFESIIKRTVDVGGLVLIPVFAVGRGQEILTALHLVKESIGEIPLFIDGLVKKGTLIYSKFSEYLRETCREALNDPWIAEEIHLKKLFSRETIATATGVIVSTSGMLLGPSLEYFKLIAENSKNCTIFVSYQAPSTPGYRVLRSVKGVLLNNELIKIKCCIETLSGFSGHSDAPSLLEYLKYAKPKKLTLLHGEENIIEKFENSIRNTLLGTSVFVPSLGEELSL